MNILAIGDIVGNIGLDFYKKKISSIIAENKVDMVIVNAENSSNGSGITRDIYNDLISYNANVITMGNHTWGRKEIFEFIEDAPYLIRPANYANELPGKGSVLVTINNHKIGVINLIGRVNMGSYECPFKRAEVEIEKLKLNGAEAIIIDFHAEATAEKKAIAYYLKDSANIVFGTHTHVQTNDDEIFDTGLGFITDIGMTGPKDSIIGMDPKAALKRFITQIPERYALAQGKAFMNSVLFSFNFDTKRVESIKKLSFFEE